MVTSCCLNVTCRARAVRQADGVLGPGEDENVFVLDQRQRDALAACVSDVLHLEERRAGDEIAVADAGQESDAAF